jgi:hypothetical protein
MDSLTTDDNTSPSHPNSINGKANEDSEELKKAEGDPSNVNDQGDEEEEEDDDDDADDEVEENGNIDIQIGFIEENERNKLFLEFDWRDWDGGKVGGLPVRK